MYTCRAATYVALVCILLLSVGVSAGESNHRYKDGEAVTLWVNKVRTVGLIACKATSRAAKVAATSCVAAVGSQSALGRAKHARQLQKENGLVYTSVHRVPASRELIVDAIDAVTITSWGLLVQCSCIIVVPACLLYQTHGNQSRQEQHGMLLLLYGLTQLVTIMAVSLLRFGVFCDLAG